MIIEFLIRGGPHNDFDIGADHFRDALHPATGKFEYLSGFGRSHLDIAVEGVTISFSPESPGWQVSFVDPPSEEWAGAIARSICDNMARLSGYDGQIVPI